MNIRTRRVVIGVAVLVAASAGLIATGPAQATPRTVNAPTGGSITFGLAPLPLPIPPLATFAGSVDDGARTVTGTIDADPIEFAFDPGDLPITVPDLPDAPMEVKIQLKTPSPGLSGSWDETGGATMSGVIRIDIGESTIGGIPIGILFGCYYDVPVQLTGTMDVASGLFDVSSDQLSVPPVTGLCAAVLGGLDQYIVGQQFAVGLQIDLGPGPTPPTTTSTTPPGSSTTTSTAPPASTSTTTSTSPPTSSTTTSTTPPESSTTTSTTPPPSSTTTSTTPPESSTTTSTTPPPSSTTTSTTPPESSTTTSTTPPPSSTTTSTTPPGSSTTTSTTPATSTTSSTTPVSTTTEVSTSTSEPSPSTSTTTIAADPSTTTAPDAPTPDPSTTSTEPAPIVSPSDPDGTDPDDPSTTPPAGEEVDPGEPLSPETGVADDGGTRPTGADRPQIAGELTRTGADIGVPATLAVLMFLGGTALAVTASRRHARRISP